MIKPLKLYFDIETNGIEDFALLSDLKVIHCLSIYQLESDKIITYHGESLIRGINELNKADVIVGHNIINFDIPALKKLYPKAFNPKGQVVDTLVLCRVIATDVASEDRARDSFPEELVGSHSLRAWGERLNFPKLDYGQQEGAFDSYNDEMKIYCEADTVLTGRLAQKLREFMPDRRMVDLENDFARLMRDQEFRGFAFDEAKAEELTRELTTKRAELTDDLQKMFPPVVEEMKTPKGWKLEIDGDEIIAETKGGLTDELRKRKMKLALAKQAIKFEPKSREIPFNPGSRPQIADRLKELGWEPKLFTPNGKPKIDESVLKGLKHPSAQKLNEYLMVTKRLGMLIDGDNSWLNSVIKGRIHGRVNTGGTVTGRCTHSSPNVAQVPAVSAPYGKECRELFKAGSGYKLVGCDASGLELRMLAHYLANFDGGEYAKVLLEGDIHSHNQQKAGLETRNQAKTFIYAFLYGAGPALIGDIVGGTARDGKILQKRFLQSLPALARFKELVDARAIKYGLLPGLDGRSLHIRSEHKALNALLQSAGAVVMKKALILLDRHLRIEGWVKNKDYAFVANIHDEFQAEVVPDRAERFGHLAVRAIVKAGKDLGLRCPLDGEFKIGDNWAETH